MRQKWSPNFKLSNPNLQIKLPELQTCTEYLPEWGRAGYSIFILLFQFLLPMITLICAYYQG